MCGKATEATWEDRVGQGEVFSRRKRDVQKRVHIPHHQLINVQGFQIKYFIKCNSFIISLPYLCILRQSESKDGKENVKKHIKDKKNIKKSKTRKHIKIEDRQSTKTAKRNTRNKTNKKGHEDKKKSTTPKISNHKKDNKTESDDAYEEEDEYKESSEEYEDVSDDDVRIVNG